ncbi:MAG: hypothetical protein R3B49_11525 [Phycisphaerales bacterium]
MLGQAAAINTMDDKRCLQCHGQEHIGELDPAERLTMVGTWLEGERPEGASDPEVGEPAGDEPATRPGLFIRPHALSGSVHGELRCVECHEDAAQLPHTPKLNVSTCASACHTEAYEQYQGGSHRMAMDEGDELAPTCASCHGGHDILAISDRRAPQHRLNSLHLCGDCHAKHLSEPDGADPGERIASYLDSAHARAVTKGGLLFAATCSDCHGAHGVQPASDPRSPVSRERVPETCGKCHEGVNEVYAQSVHGKLLAEGDDRGPVCTSCHTAHSISQASSPTFMLDVLNECGQCHDTPPEDGERIGSYYETYRKSYHGQVTGLGSTRAARCSDCHGAHDIKKGSDPESRVNEANLVQTCAACHPGANAKFAQFDPHANYRDGKNYPILHGVWLYFMVMMSVVFTFFGLHSVAWFFRSLYERRKHGVTSHHGATTRIRRFTTINRVNHALVVISFFGLTATGIPLVFNDEAWARGLASVFGGVRAAGLWHRFFAIMLILNFVIHFVGLARSFRRRTCSAKEWALGANSLTPRVKDVADVLGMLRWFAVGGKRPKIDRWAYWEKFDYWAEVGGSAIIGGSGLLLWFPEIASKVVPGWAFNVAMIVHGYEALLAICFIFSIHFFNAHLRPETFPVDDVIFTGSVPEEELKEQRPAEYERLVATGQLEKLRVHG